VHVSTGLRVAAVLTATMMTTGCLLGFASVEGSGNIVTLRPDLTGCTEVSAGNGARTRIVAGDDYSVVVRIDDNLQDDVRVEVEDGRLHIGMRSMFNYRNPHFEVDVTLPDLVAVSVSDGARTVLSGFDLDHAMDTRVSGGARLEGCAGRSPPLHDRIRRCPSRAGRHRGVGHRAWERRQPYRPVVLHC